MARTTDETTTPNASDDQRDAFYLPAMPALSDTPGPIERFVRNLLSRRGDLRPVARRKDR